MPFQLRRIARAVEDVVVEPVGFRHAGFDREDREAHLRCEELQHPVFELKELPRPVGRFAERHDARVADDGLQGLHVGKAASGLDSGERDGPCSYPLSR
jgi:hypothetical protein